jgi:hypothetical protein
MNVFVLVVGEYSDRDVAGVFSSMALAKRYCETKYSTVHWIDDQGGSWSNYGQKTVAIYPFRVDSLR